jgi:hypothetical protein
LHRANVGARLQQMGGKRMAQRVHRNGLHNPSACPVLPKQLNSGLPVTLRNLRALAEARSAAQPIIPPEAA